MGTTADKLQYLIDAKNSISAAIEEKGGTVPQELSGYGPAIAALPSGVSNFTTVQYSNESLSSYYDTTEIATLTNSQIGALSAIQSMKTGKGVTKIDTSFFQPASGTNTALRSFDCNELTSIGGYAFYTCANLSSIVLNDGLKEIGAQTFRDCVRLLEIAIPNSVSSIGDGAFRGCSGLSSVTIPNSMTVGGNQMFYACNNISSVTIPEGVTSIGYGVFFGCEKLESVSLPSTLTSIGSSSFEQCYRLVALTIPSTLTTVGTNQFRNMGLSTNLPTVTFSERTMAQVQAMSYYPWGARTGTQFACTDGTITV